MEQKGAHTVMGLIGIVWTVAQAHANTTSCTRYEHSTRAAGPGSACCEEATQPACM
jgi:hypothetical protein